MIKQIQELGSNISNVVIYCSSSSLQYELIKILQKVADCNSDTVLSVRSSKELKDTDITILNAPFWGGKWYADIDCEQLGVSDIVSSLKSPSPFALKVHWVSKYATYKKIKDLDVVKKNKVKASFYYMGKLSYDCIFRLHNIYKIGKEPLLDEKLLKFVAKNYNYDVQEVCNLFILLKSGTEAKTQKDIMELIGVGGNSIDKFLIKLLTTTYKSEKGLKMVISRRVKLLNDLNITYSYSAIRNILERNLESLILLKQLHLMGKLTKLNPKIPETFETPSIQKLRRYETTLKDEISLPMLLNLKMLFTKYSTYDAQNDLMLIIYEYILLRYVEKE